MTKVKIHNDVSNKDVNSSKNSKKKSNDTIGQSFKKSKNTGDEKFQKAHVLLNHESIIKKGRSAPLPANYPYEKRMRRANYEARKQELQIELLKVLLFSFML